MDISRYWILSDIGYYQIMDIICKKNKPNFQEKLECNKILHLFLLQINEHLIVFVLPLKVALEILVLNVVVEAAVSRSVGRCGPWGKIKFSIST